MDLIMPVMDGVEATRRIMKLCPCPILIVTSTVTGNSAKVFEAMGAGALDAVVTPVLGGGDGVKGKELLVKIDQIAKITGIEKRFPAQSQTKTGELGASRQAKGPFLNPVEMAMESAAAVIAAIADGNNPKSEMYRRLFKKVYGVDLRAVDYTNDVLIETLYDKVAQAIATFEQTKRLTSFSSKYDYYLAGKATLTRLEEEGLALFEGKANCSACHPSAAQFNADGTITPPLFTDFTYDNLGVPKNLNDLVVNCPTDYGLGGRLSEPTEDGKFRVSSLRNIEMTAPYTHNGYFATLDDIVHFYNTRDVENWPLPEVAVNVNPTELGDLRLTAREEAALVAFLQTLTDGFEDKMPANFVLPSITPLN
jgi:cytochrome c peroxidase